jgi:group I intron endonuclease
MILYEFNLSIATRSQVFDIIREMRGKELTGGIYLWVNQVSQKMYVGSTMNFYNRIGNYYSLKSITRVIQKALQKYDYSSFTLILVFVPNASRELVLQLEQHVLDNWVCDYNCQPNATSASRLLTTEHKAKIAISRKDMLISEETRARMSTSHLGERNGRFNKGTPVYLYEVNSTKLELSATFPNRFRATPAL